MPLSLSVKHASGNANGKPLLVTGTDLAGANPVMTAVAGANDFDAVTFEIHNGDAIDIDVSVVFDTAGTPVTVPLAIPPYGMRQYRVRVNGGIVVKAFASVASKISIVALIEFLDF